MKPTFDLVFGILLVALLTAPALLLVLLVRVKLGPPVFFTQTRPGLHGQPFQMIKFRTMTNARADNGTLLPDCERLTCFGCFLRSTSLDELPEILNVLKGEMILVGPRPLLMDYLPLYSLEQSRRHEVKPGITGWAQVNGRNAISWEEKFQLDVWYVDHQSFILDLRIIFITLLKVWCRNGVDATEGGTMPAFMKSTKTVNN